MHHSLIKKKKKRWQLGINCWGGKKKKNHQDIRTGNSSLFHLEPHHTTLSLIIFLLQHTYFLLVRVYKGTSRLQIIIRSIRITYEYSFMLLSFLSVYPSYIYFSSPCISSSLLISPLSYCLSLSFILTVFLYFVTALHFLLLSAFPLSFSCIFSSSAFLVFNSSLSLSFFYLTCLFSLYISLSCSLFIYFSICLSLLLFLLVLFSL